MTKRILYFILLLTIASSSYSQAIPVEVVQRDGNWTLLRGGEPYYIRGCGGQTHLDKVVEIGGNSIRTWGLDQLNDGLLDDAHERGLSVMLGLWAGHERHGFDYNDPIAVRSQLERFRRAVEKYKDHPAILLWGVGNEVDLFYSNTKVWDAIQDIAAMIHEVDPNHPTCTVTAGLDPEEVRLIKEKAPDIDIYGVNTYGELDKVVANIRNWGWEGPYIISEWGVNGHWESPTTDFGVPIEQTSHEKAKSFNERYSLIEGDAAQCIGSYAFLWGSKQETTSTWYGLFTLTGESSEAIDVLHRRWGGYPGNYSPVLRKVFIEGKEATENIYLTADDMAQALVDVEDPDGDNMRFHWSIVPESTDKKAGGDKESAPLAVRGSVKRGGSPDHLFRVPRKEGPYRLFVYAMDGNGHAGTANIPFYVLPRPKEAEQARGVQFKVRELDIPNR